MEKAADIDATLNKHFQFANIMKPSVLITATSSDVSKDKLYCQQTGTPYQKLRTVYPRVSMEEAVVSRVKPPIS